MRMLFFDTETTGLKPGQIGQLSYIIVDTDRGLIARNYFFKVKEVDPSASAVTGLTKEKLDILSEGKVFGDYIDEILEDFNSVDLLIAHNMDFDMKFINAEFERCGVYFNAPLCFCSMKYYTDICKIPNPNPRYGGYKFPRLEEVINFMGIEDDKVKDLCNKLYKETSIDFHDSRYDIVSTYVMLKEGIYKGYMPRGFLTNAIKEESYIN